jgi:hypothetical protein
MSSRIKQLEEENEILEACMTRLQYDLFNLTCKCKRLEAENVELFAQLKNVRVDSDT